MMIQKKSSPPIYESAVHPEVELLALPVKELVVLAVSITATSIGICFFKSTTCEDSLLFPNQNFFLIQFCVIH